LLQSISSNSVGLELDDDDDLDEDAEDQLYG
jgi:hypothetical protein